MLTPNQDLFLSLAGKVLSDRASSQEREDLTKLLERDSDLASEFSELQAELQRERDHEMTERFLRVLCKVASPDEVKEVQALKRDPLKWQEFQRAKFFL